MKYTLEYPSELPTAPDDFLQPEVIRAVAAQAEAAGFSAVALSEHPERLHNRLTEAGRDPSVVDIQVVCPHTDLDDEASRRRAREVRANSPDTVPPGPSYTWTAAAPQASLDYIKAFGEAMGLVAERDISASRL